MLELFLIALIICFVTDISGFPHSMLKVLWRYAFKERPFPESLSWTDIHPLLQIVECSTCQVWWTTLIVSICCGWWSVGIMAFCAFLAFMAPVFTTVLNIARDFLYRLIDAFANYFGL